jgi:hypothetical protein
VKTFQSTALAVLSALIASVAFAQSQDMKALAQQFGESAKANADELKMYSWTMRVSVTLKDDPKPAKLFMMRFNAAGQLEKTPLNPAPPPEEGRGLRGHIKEKKIAEFKDWSGDLVDLCKQYLVPSPALLQSFFAKVLTTQAPGGFVQLYATDVISPGDKLTYEIDPKTKAIHRVLFHATLDGDPIDGTVQMGQVPGGGPTYAATTTVTAPAKKLVATIEEFEYVKQ